jgi:hypothetical protein
MFFYRIVTASCPGLYYLDLGVANDDSVSGNGWYWPPLYGYSCPDPAQTFSTTGTLNPRTLLSLNSVSAVSGSWGTANWSYNEALSDQPSSLAAVTGSWVTQYGTVITADSSGVLSETDPDSSGCVLTGQISVINPAENVYGVVMAYSRCVNVLNDLENAVGNGNTAQLNSAQITGLASVDNTVTPNQLELWLLLQFPQTANPNAIAYIAATPQ